MAILIEIVPPSREQLVHQLYEAAEIEHTLMCTYLYAAFSLRSGEAEGLSAEEAVAVAGWRRTIIQVAIEEMSHLAAVWNITSALGGAPRFGRGNFPLDPGALPAGIVVKLAPFSESVVQHFVHLERPACSEEPDGEGFSVEQPFSRRVDSARLTPMVLDYETIGAFYASLGSTLKAFVNHVGEAAAFSGDSSLQLSQEEVSLPGATPVVCMKTALNAFAKIVEQGEGASRESNDSHYQKFLEIRDALARLKAENPAFQPAFPAATNPVLRPPMGRVGRVWIEHEEAAAAVDLANTGYALMLRLLAYSYVLPRSTPEKALAVGLATGLMRAVTLFAERAARLPAGPSNPDFNAGVSFTALRDAASLPLGPSASRFLVERLRELLRAANKLAEGGDERVVRAAGIVSELAERAEHSFNPTQAILSPGVDRASPRKVPLPIAPAGDCATIAGVDYLEAEDVTLIYEGKRCIHSRFCVTYAPDAFLANVPGQWIRPERLPADVLVEVAHLCPSGAIRYRRKDGKEGERAPPVNLIAVREAGPYGVRADLVIQGQRAPFRATLCRCGASKDKPYCDGSHRDVNFSASGEPPSQTAVALDQRDGLLEIEPETNGPLQVRGNLEITSGTGRVVARLRQARLCRCGGSSSKPFCDGTHARIGFSSR